MIKLGDIKDGRSAFSEQFENEEMLLQDGEELSNGAKWNGHLQDTTCSWRQCVGEIQPGGRKSMQMIERWTIYRDFSLKQECCSDI